MATRYQAPDDSEDPRDDYDREDQRELAERAGEVEL
jgi:hypothetical protein